MVIYRWSAASADHSGYPAGVKYKRLSESPKDSVHKSRSNFSDYSQQVNDGPLDLLSEASSDLRA